MAIIKQNIYYGGGRIDAPHLRSIESGVAGDFDVLAGRILAGSSPLIVRGFDVITSGAVGAFATSLQVNTANSLLIHYLASESGSIFNVPSDRAVETLSSTNTRITGGFTASATNYVGIDLRRSSDSATADVMQFINSVTQSETPQRVALARTLDYVFVISTADFGSLSGVCPIAKVTTDSSNRVTAITDARNMLGRLATGGTVPSSTYAYAWPGTRSTSTTSFSNADKAITSLKEWMDAAMTRLWEIGGGERWYSATADRNVTLMRAGTTFSNGEWFEWDATNLHWRGLTMVFDNSTGWKNTISDQTGSSTGLTNLADGECIYVDIDRTSNATVTAAKAVLTTLGTPTVPGSRYILAWRNGANVFTRGSGFPVGAAFTAATTTSLGIVKLSATSGTPTAPVVYNPDANGALTVAATGGNAVGITVTGNGSGAGIFGTGGATGIGVKGVGTGTGAGGDFTGGATGVGLIVRSSASTNTAPIFESIDSAGNIRYIFDRYGFPMGRNCIIDENWDTFFANCTTSKTIPENQRWFVDMAGTSPTVAWINATGNPNLASPVVKITPGQTGTSGFANIDTVSTLIALANANLAVVCEFEFCMSTTSNNTIWSVGLGNDLGTGLVGTTVMAQSTNGGAWNFLVNGATVGSPGPTPTTGTITPSGSMDKIRIIYSRLHNLAALYINGTIVASTTATMTAGSVGFIACGKATASAPTGYGLLSPVRIAFSRYASAI
jgi:hypothetical protein